MIWIHVTSLPPPYALRATSSGSSLLWTVLNSTTPSTSKHTAQPWEHARLHHTLTYSSLHLRQTHLHMHHTSQTPSGASSTTFMIWTHTEDKLRTFITYLNNIHPTIKFTSSHSAGSTSFLDVKVSLNQFGKVGTDLYTKPTDEHQYLLQSSYHPLHANRAIPFSLALRLRLIASKESFTLRVNELIQYHNDRGCSLYFLKKEFQRAHAITHNETLKSSRTATNQPSRVPLVITYNPAVRFISSIMQRHFKILSSSPRSSNVFQTTPLVAFRRTDNLSDILVRTKLRSDKQTDVTKGSFWCGKNCITCRYMIDGCTNYTFSGTDCSSPLVRCRHVSITNKHDDGVMGWWPTRSWDSMEQ